MAQTSPPPQPPGFDNSGMRCIPAGIMAGICTNMHLWAQDVLRHQIVQDVCGRVLQDPHSLNTHDWNVDVGGHEQFNIRSRKQEGCSHGGAYMPGFRPCGINMQESARQVRACAKFSIKSAMDFVVLCNRSTRTNSSGE